MGARVQRSSLSAREYEIGQGSSTVVTKKDVNLADGVRFDRQEPISGRGKATGCGAFEMQSAQAVSAAYYFNLAARDYILADGAIELVIEGVPCSALIEPSQSGELIFCDRWDGLRGRNHGADSGEFRCDLQEQTQARDEERKREFPRFQLSRITFPISASKPKQSFAICHVKSLQILALTVAKNRLHRSDSPQDTGAGKSPISDILQPESFPFRCPAQV